MSRHPRRITASPRRPLTLALLAGMLITTGAYAAGDETVRQTTANVPYVSGGIGIDAIDRLDAMTGQFNVKLVFAFKSGEYLSDVKVSITDAAGKAVLDTVSDGPWLMTKLRPGQYQVVTTFAGQVEKRALSVGAARLNTVDFRWNRQ